MGQREVYQALPLGIQIAHPFGLAGEEMTLAESSVGLACGVGLLDALALAGHRAPLLEAISGRVVDTAFGVDLIPVFVVKLPPIRQGPLGSRLSPPPFGLVLVTIERSVAVTGFFDDEVLDFLGNVGELIHAGLDQPFLC